MLLQYSRSLDFKAKSVGSHTSRRYSAMVPLSLCSKCSGLPASSSSSSSGKLLSRSTSAHSRSLLLETYRTFSFESFSRPVCSKHSWSCQGVLHKLLLQFSKNSLRSRV